MSAPLLVELFTEELPPRALRRLGEAFADAMASGLAARGLAAADAPVEGFATPRRLALRVAGVLERAPDRSEARRLMPAKVAFDAEGRPTPALAKRLEREGVAADAVAPGALERRADGGQEYVFLTVALPGATLAEGLQQALDEALTKLPIPKVMSYQLADGLSTVHFVRPAHGLLALHGRSVVPVGVLGLQAGRVTAGHRFQGARTVEIADAADYEARLGSEGGVIPGFDARQADIRRQLEAHAAALGLDLRLAERAALLDEVTSLVEMPTVYVGGFEPEFLRVPQECLILTMQQNQKYFPLFDAAGKLDHRFLIVSNMRLADPANIVEGNQRVVRPRLADARFFYETDLKTPLADRVGALGAIVYMKGLGSQLERIGRIERLARAIAGRMGAGDAVAAMAARAARLAKADLTTGMVGEFPELQGIMGRYYALADGEPAPVAEAVEQHYRPRFAGDALPEGPVATAVALAEKLDSLAGLFGLGQLPSGDKDPYGLRRAALGVIRILVEGQLDLPLNVLVEAAFAEQPEALKRATAELETFVLERLRGYLREQGYTALEVEAVLSDRPMALDRVPAQLAAVREFMLMPEGAALAAANKRVANILRKVEEAGELMDGARRDRMVEPAELALYDAMEGVSPEAARRFEARDYTGYLKSFAALKAPVDAFFDHVMVMADDPDLRRNRIALLEDLRRLMNRVADIARLAA